MSAQPPISVKYPNLEDRRPRQLQQLHEGGCVQLHVPDGVYCDIRADAVCCHDERGPAR